MTKERLNKYLARCEVASRRAADRLIEQGLISVNGKKVKELGRTILPESDRISYQGKLVTPAETVTIMLNKPKGYITTKTDPIGRKTIYDLLDARYKGLHPIGRLDRNTTGLILLTNDGMLTQKLLHPKFHCAKTYRVRLEKPLIAAFVDRLLKGVTLEDGIAAAQNLEIVELDDKHTLLDITVTEGRNHLVRRMFSTLGFEITHLRRLRFAGLSLGTLKLSAYRELSPKQLKMLLKHSAVKKQRD